MMTNCVSDDDLSMEKIENVSMMEVEPEQNNSTTNSPLSNQLSKQDQTIQECNLLEQNRNRDIVLSDSSVDQSHRSFQNETQNNNCLPTTNSLDGVTIPGIQKVVTDVFHPNQMVMNNNNALNHEASMDTNTSQARF